VRLLGAGVSNLEPHRGSGGAENVTGLELDFESDAPLS
jgi:hypothetical protein